MKLTDKRRECKKCGAKMVHRLGKDGFYYECKCGNIERRK